MITVNNVLTNMLYKQWHPGSLYSVNGSMMYRQVDKTMFHNVGGYIMYGQADPTNVYRMGGYVLVAEAELPKFREGPEALSDMVYGLNDKDIPGNGLLFGPPEPIVYKNRNTRVFVTVKDRPDIVGGYMHYDRVSVGRLQLPLDFKVETANNAHDLIQRIRDVTDVYVTPRDFVNHALAGHIYLEATTDSYFFLPGSSVNIRR